MKYIIILVLFCTNQICAQSKIYDVEVSTLDSTKESLRYYPGQKILIATGHPNYLRKAGVKFLDSLKSLYPALVIIAVPVQDSSIEDTRSDIDLIQNNRAKKIIVGTVANTADNKSERQNKLVKFLTDVGENTHFDQELTTDFTIYLISESGYLYATLNKSTSAKTLNELIRQEDVKQ
jgi:glutathione peroxidase-family protein